MDIVPTRRFVSLLFAATDAGQSSHVRLVDRADRGPASRVVYESIDRGGTP
jgi:hypothetical protein